MAETLPAALHCKIARGLCGTCCSSLGPGHWFCKTQHGSRAIYDAERTQKGESMRISRAGSWQFNFSMGRYKVMQHER